MVSILIKGVLTQAMTNGPHLEWGEGRFTPTFRRLMKHASLASGACPFEVLVQLRGQLGGRRLRRVQHEVIGRMLVHGFGVPLGQPDDPIGTLGFPAHRHAGIAAHRDPGHGDPVAGTRRATVDPLRRTRSALRRRVRQPRGRRRRRGRRSIRGSPSTAPEAGGGSRRRRRRSNTRRHVLLRPGILMRAWSSPRSTSRSR